MWRRNRVLGISLITLGSGLIVSTFLSGWLAFLTGVGMIVAGVCILMRC